MLPSETMIWQPEFTDKTLSRKPGAVQGKRSAIIFCRMRVLHKTCYVPLSTGQVTAHPPTRKQH
ncbi:hypothetical protein ECDEC6C_5375 [Escherichia coli DEC6C]|nr:hypothetical protein ECDEC6C_5375 [Escherichia coli DEC6C]